MADIIQRFTSLLSSNAFTVSSSGAIQVSGGPSSNWPLTSVSASFQPNYHRMGVSFTNNDSTNFIYLGNTSGVTASSGWFKKLAPSEFFQYNLNGSIPIWAIAGGGTPYLTMEEFA